jgi:hypothetical protein
MLVDTRERYAPKRYRRQERCPNDCFAVYSTHAVVLSSARPTSRGAAARSQMAQDLGQIGLWIRRVESRERPSIVTPEGTTTTALEPTSR